MARYGNRAIVNLPGLTVTPTEMLEPGARGRPPRARWCVWNPMTRASCGVLVAGALDVTRSLVCGFVRDTIGRIVARFAGGGPCVTAGLTRCSWPARPGGGAQSVSSGAP
jgi:hypothetical protein